MTFLGIASIMAGLLMGLYGAHLARIPAWDRPGFALSAAYRVFWNPARHALLAAGLLVLLQVGPVPAILAAVLLLALWARLAWVRSARYAASSIEREVEALRSVSPGRPLPECIREVILSRHPEWGPELAEQIARDHPTVEAAAAILARMERGWQKMG